MSPSPPLMAALRLVNQADWPLDVPAPAVRALPGRRKSSRMVWSRSFSYVPYHSCHLSHWPMSILGCVLDAAFDQQNIGIMIRLKKARRRTKTAFQQVQRLRMWLGSRLASHKIWPLDILIHASSPLVTG